MLPSDATLQELESGPSKRLRKALTAVESEYEAILIDCPPSLGNLTRSALTASRHALVVVEPSALGLRGIGGVADLIDDVWDATNPDLELAGIVLNRVPAVSREAQRRIDELAQIVGRTAIWSPPIPQRVVFNQAVGDRRSIHSFGSACRRTDRRVRFAVEKGSRHDPLGDELTGSPAGRSAVGQFDQAQTTARVRRSAPRYRPTGG